jgi:hypothetical protein
MLLYEFTSHQGEFSNTTRTAERSTDLRRASYRRTDTLRLWSIHPRHLDARGLVALWREGLLARAVLLGRTTGYRHHPQLQRFLHRQKPVRALDCYLSCVLDEARARGYRFDERKIRYRRCQHARAHVSRGQLHYEWQHLLKKVAKRDRSWWRSQLLSRPRPHPCFRVVPGPLATWERP